MKKLLLVVSLTIISLGIDAQGYSCDKVAFTNFLVRMYNNAPFDGVRAVNDYDNAYLISVLALEPAKYKTMKCYQSCGFREGNGAGFPFLNGSNITQDMIIHTTERMMALSTQKSLRTFVKFCGVCEGNGATDQFQTK